MAIKKMEVEINVWFNIDNGENIKNFNKLYPKTASIHSLNTAAANSLIALRKDLFEKFNIHLIITSSFRESNDNDVGNFLQRYTTNSKEFLAWAKNRPEALAEEINFRNNLNEYINLTRGRNYEWYFWYFNC